MPAARHFARVPVAGAAVRAMNGAAPAGRFRGAEAPGHSKAVELGQGRSSKIASAR